MPATEKARIASAFWSSSSVSYLWPEPVTNGKNGEYGKVAKRTFRFGRNACALFSKRSFFPSWNGHHPTAVQLIGSTSALVSEAPIEAFDEAVLSRLPRLYQLQLAPVVTSPLTQSLTGELRSLVCPDSLRMVFEGDYGIKCAVTWTPEIPLATGMSRHSLVKSSTMVRHFIRRPHAQPKKLTNAQPTKLARRSYLFGMSP